MFYRTEFVNLGRSCKNEIGSSVLLPKPNKIPGIKKCRVQRQKEDNSKLHVKTTYRVQNKKRIILSSPASFLFLGSSCKNEIPGKKVKRTIPVQYLELVCLA